MADVTPPSVENSKRLFPFGLLQGGLSCIESGGANLSAGPAASRLHRHSSLDAAPLTSDAAPLIARRESARALAMPAGGETTACPRGGSQACPAPRARHRQGRGPLRRVDGQASRPREDISQLQLQPQPSAWRRRPTPLSLQSLHGGTHARWHRTAEAAGSPRAPRPTERSRRSDAAGPRRSRASLPSLLARASSSTRSSVEM